MGIEADMQSAVTFLLFFVPSFRNSYRFDFNLHPLSRGVSVPGQVSALSLSGDAQTLRLSWSPPRGDWENYTVLLRNGSVVLANDTVSKASRQHTFSILGLVPGRLYSAEVTVHSGMLGNSARCSVRLGQCSPASVLSFQSAV